MVRQRDTELFNGENIFFPTNGTRTTECPQAKEQSQTRTPGNLWSYNKPIEEGILESMPLSAAPEKLNT